MSNELNEKIKQISQRFASFPDKFGCELEALKEVQDLGSDSLQPDVISAIKSEQPIGFKIWELLILYHKVMVLEIKAFATKT